MARHKRRGRQKCEEDGHRHAVYAEPLLKQKTTTTGAVTAKEEDDDDEDKENQNDEVLLAARDRRIDELLRAQPKNVGVACRRWGPRSTPHREQGERPDHGQAREGDLSAQDWETRRVMNLNPAIAA